jgi:hypothetical protein
MRGLFELEILFYNYFFGAAISFGAIVTSFISMSKAKF